MLKRDGFLKSLWQQDIPAYKSVNKYTKNSVCDVAIVGGGITGITLALLLQKSGKKCIVLEAHSLCFGTTGGTTAHLNNFMDTPYSKISSNFGEGGAQQVADAAEKAIQLIENNINKYKIDCEFVNVVAHLFACDDNQKKDLEDIVEGFKKVGIKSGFVSEVDVPIPFVKAVEIPGQARFHPTAYVMALAAEFEAAGGIIVQQCRVENTEGEAIIDISTSVGNYSANTLVYATHTPPGVNLLHLRMAPWRSYAIAVRLEDDAYPEALCYDLYDPYRYYRKQIVNNIPYLIVGGEDHKTAHEEDTDSCLKRLEDHVRDYFQVKSVEFKWSSQYYEPVDGIPYIGNYPGHNDNIFVATGFGGNGMIYSAVAALLLKDLVEGKDHPWKELFNPKRVKPVAGFVGFVKNNADVAKDFIGKWFSSEKIEKLSELKAGEGKVVKYEEHMIALHKDDNGQLHAVSPACTHLKCSVAWNPSEKSWDCPCHGARFNMDGELLNGPANTDLEKIDLKSDQ